MHLDFEVADHLERTISITTRLVQPSQRNCTIHQQDVDAPLPCQRDTGSQAVHGRIQLIPLAQHVAQRHVGQTRDRQRLPIGSNAKLLPLLEQLGRLLELPLMQLHICQNIDREHSGEQIPSHLARGNHLC